MNTGKKLAMQTEGYVRSTESKTRNSKQKRKGIQLKSQKTSLRIGQKITPNGIIETKKVPSPEIPLEEIDDPFKRNCIEGEKTHIDQILFDSQEILTKMIQMAHQSSGYVSSSSNQSKKRKIAIKQSGSNEFNSADEDQEIMGDLSEDAQHRDLKSPVNGINFTFQEEEEEDKNSTKKQQVNKKQEYAVKSVSPKQGDGPMISVQKKLKTNDQEAKQRGSFECSEEIQHSVIQLNENNKVDDPEATDNSVRNNAQIQNGVNFQQGGVNGNSLIVGASERAGRSNFSLVDSLVVRKNGKYSDEYEIVMENTSSQQKDDKKLIMLGRGGFGQVYLVRQRGGNKEKRAMKIVMKSQASKYREVIILKKFSHPNVLKIYEYFEDDERIYVITELCYGLNLFEYKVKKQRQFSEAEMCRIADGVLRALAEAHKQGIVHRDVKPDNIMLDFNDEGDKFIVKLIDWGLADQIPTSRLNVEGKIQRRYLTKQCGTLHYLAPEVLSKRYNEKVDLWSLGMSLFSLIQGSPPICGTNSEIVEQISKYRCSFKYQCWSSVSDEGKDLISRLLEIDINLRLSAVEALSHPWFRMFPVENVIDTQDLRSSYNNLLSYAKQNIFKKTILGFFASHMITKRDRIRFIDIFQTLDTDKNGELSITELQQGFAKIFTNEEIKLCNEEIETIFGLSLSSKFENASGIKYEEFLSSMLVCSSNYSQDQLLNAFKLFDKDGNGKITLQEIIETLEIPQHSEIIDSFKESIQQIDTNLDGEIDFEEFKQIMTNFLDKNSQVILSQDHYLS